MKISLVTPTRGNRPGSFAFLERLVAAQTCVPLEWIAANDGRPYEYSMGQRVIVHPRSGVLNHSLNENLWHGLSAVSEEADAVAVLCDDDWYAPGYLEAMGAALGDSEAIEMKPLLYYNVVNRTLFKLNRYADLSALFVRRSLVPWLQTVCARPSPHIDRCFWNNFSGPRSYVKNDKLHLGIKGLPRSAPVDPVAHRFAGIKDDGSFLRLWVGEESAAILDKLAEIA